MEFDAVVRVSIGDIDSQCVLAVARLLAATTRSAWPSDGRQRRRRQQLVSFVMLFATVVVVTVVFVVVVVVFVPVVTLPR